MIQNVRTPDCPVFTLFSVVACERLKTKKSSNEKFDGNFKKVKLITFIPINPHSVLFLTTNGLLR